MLKTGHVHPITRTQAGEARVAYISRQHLLTDDWLAGCPVPPRITSSIEGGGGIVGRSGTGITTFLLLIGRRILLPRLSHA